MPVQSIASPHATACIFITLSLKASQETLETLEDFCGRLPAIVNSLRTRYPEDEFDVVMGIGSKAWDTLFPAAQKPAELAEFEEIKGPKRTAVSTPADLFFQIKGGRMDMCYEAARLIHELLAEVVEPLDETHGFRYFDGRAILGFVDGTENSIDDEIFEYGYIGSEDSEFEGGSYVFIQKYIHDMDYWNGLTTEQQESAIGRRKFDDLELEDDAKDENAHTVVSKAYRGDDEVKIVRANYPFAEPSKNLFGTYFVGYARSFETTNTMLKNMYLGTPEGNYDRLLDFSEPVTGSLFFVPSPSTLDAIANGELA